LISKPALPAAPVQRLVIGRIVMTMPHLMNCQHSEEGWCLDCVKSEHDSNEETIRELMVQCERLKEQNDCFDTRVEELEAQVVADIKNAGRCPKCSELVYASEFCKKCRPHVAATHPQYQHTEAELRHIADLLAALNGPHPDLDTVGFEGELQLYWCDRVMGVVSLDDGNDRRSWVYEPWAKGKEQPGGD
jgi:hypothetical protein